MLVHSLTPASNLFLKSLPPCYASPDYHRLSLLSYFSCSSVFLLLFFSVKCFLVFCGKSSRHLSFSLTRDALSVIALFACLCFLSSVCLPCLYAYVVSLPVCLPVCLSVCLCRSTASTRSNTRHDVRLWQVHPATFSLPWTSSCWCGCRDNASAPAAADHWTGTWPFHVTDAISWLVYQCHFCTTYWPVHCGLSVYCRWR